MLIDSVYATESTVTQTNSHLLLCETKIICDFIGFFDNKMENNSDESSASLNICNEEPVLFVCADNETNFEEKIHVDCSVLNIQQLEFGDILSSPTLYIQGLPFIIQIGRSKSKTNDEKGNKSDVLKIQLKAGNKIDSWSSKFSIELHAIHSENHPIEFSKTVKEKWDNSHGQVLHSIDWDEITNLTDLLFEVNLSAEFPNEGYVWPSREATGFAGLQNEGATCYINSLLQSLFCTNEFRRFVYGLEIEPEDVNDSFVFWLKYIFYAMQFGGLHKIRTNKMVNCFQWDEMSTTAQQDIHEFLRRLMDKLEQYVDGTEFKERLTHLFVGVLETTTTCKAIDYVTKKEETFWDLQLPIEDDEDIFGAFQTYLQTLTIPDYKHENGKAEAIQEYKFTTLPPILHVQLRRFKYDSETNTISKNNKRFQFYAKIDLSEHCADAIYTLHSVLVHSGKSTSGHYMAYICPKLDGKWFKFNDDTVTKCSSNDAVKSNYGDDNSSSNAYILAYIKNSCASQILQDVTINDVVSLDLIKAEMAKEKADISFKEKHLEVIVHTPETLLMNEKLKRGKQLIEQRFGVKFALKKDKSVDDLLQTLATVFRLGYDTQKIILWTVPTKESAISLFDIDQNLNKRLSDLFKKNSLNLFMEFQPMDELNSNVFDHTIHAIIFIKEYDSLKQSLTFVSHRYFELQQTVQDVRAFIREVTEYEGDDENIAIIEEKYSEDNYHPHWLTNPKQLIRKFVSKLMETCSAVITFEILNDSSHRKPKYLSLFDNLGSTGNLRNKSADGLLATANPLNQIPKPVVSNLVNSINITVKHDREELFTHEFRIEDTLFEIVNEICTLLDITSDCIELLDNQHNVIDKEFLSTSIQKYSQQQNRTMRTTRHQKKKGLVFNCNV